MIETERLMLRPWRVTDAAVRRELWTERDPRVPPHRRIDAQGHPTVEEIAARIAEERGGLLAIERKEFGDVIGYSGIVDDGSGEPELAYELLRRTWGRGYATEASRAVIEWATAAGMRELGASVRVWNCESLRVLEKLGFVDSGRVDVDDVHGDSRYFTKDLSG